MKKNKDDLKIKRWLCKGEFSDDAKTIGDVKELLAESEE